MSSQGIKFMKSVFSTMNYLLYGPIGLTGTRPLTRPFHPAAARDQGRPDGKRLLFLLLYSISER